MKIKLQTDYFFKNFSLEFAILINFSPSGLSKTHNVQARQVKIDRGLQFGHD